jgi:hypothetical protein
MPKYFHWHSPNLDWDKQLAKYQCEGIAKSGNRCGRQVIMGLPLCYQHTQSTYKVKAKASRIPHAGVGLFAFDKTKGPNEIVFRPGNRICPYFGEIIDKNELDARYGDHTAPYGIKLSQNRYQDGAAQRGIGTLINHTPRASSNCRFTNNYQFISIAATKIIRNDQELLVSYGNNYLFNEPGVRYSTNTRRR